MTGNAISHMHILNGNTGEIVATLDNTEGNLFWGAEQRKDLESGENAFEFFTDPNQAATEHLTGKFRALIPDEDGSWAEYVVLEMEQEEHELFVIMVGSEVMHDKEKIMEIHTHLNKQPLEYAALAETKTWKAGRIDYVPAVDLDITEYIGPFTFLKMAATALGLELVYRVETDGYEVTGRYYDMVDRVGMDTDKIFEPEKDLIRLKKSVNTENAVTSLFVVGPEKDDGTRLTTTVTNYTALQNWGWQGEHLIEVYAPDGATANTPLEVLQRMGADELNKRIAALFEYEVEAVSIEHLFPNERAHLGDRVGIVNTLFNPPVYAEARIIGVTRRIDDMDLKTLKIGEIVEKKKADVTKTLISLIGKYNTRVIRSAAAPAGSESIIWIQTGGPFEIPHTWDGAAWVPSAATEASEIGAATPAEVADAKNAAVTEANTYTDSALENFQTTIDTTFKDGIIEEAEARAIEKYKNSLTVEKGDQDNRYTTLYSNVQLEGTPKTDLATAKTNYNTAYTDLLNAVDTAIADGKTTAAEKASVDAAFVTYKTRTAELSTAFENATNAIAEKKAKTAEADALRTTDIKIGEAQAENQEFVQGYANKKIAQQSTAPLNPAAGDLWLDTSDASKPAVWKTWDGSAWKNASATNLAELAGQIVENQLAMGAVTSGKLLDGAITNAKIAAGAVTELKISDLAITNKKLSDLAVDAAKLAADAVTAEKIVSGAVTNEKILDSAINAAKIASGAVTELKIGSGAITNTKLADLSIDAAKLQDSAVTSTKIANLAVGTAAIADAAITNAKIKELDAAKITTGRLDAARIQIGSGTTFAEGFDPTTKATPDYIASRGENLVTNGSGLLRDNTNFKSFVFDGSQAQNSAGSFRYANAGTLRTDEFIPVNPEYRYLFEQFAKTLNGVGKYFAFIDCYDVDNQVISATTHMYKANTLTALKQDLKPGDTVMYLNSAANWDNTGTAGVNTHLRSIILWNYRNSFGYLYPPLTYSRNWYGDAWNPGAIDFVNNTVTLKAPWARPLVPAGTELSNGSSGSSYKYLALSNTVVPKEWTYYSGVISGVDTTGTNRGDKFPPGTAKAKIGWLMNYQSTGETAWFTNVSFRIDVETPTGAQEKADAAKTAAAADAKTKADAAQAAAIAEAKTYSDAAVKPANDRIALWQYADTTFIDGGDIYTNTITANQIAAGTVTAASGIIADAAITSAKIANLAVGTAAIQDLAVTSAKIQALDAAKITTGTLDADRIAANSLSALKITAGTITATQLAADSVIADKIATGAVTADAIAANSITSNMIATIGLDAAVIKFGTMSGDRILANTIDANRLKSGTIIANDITFTGMLNGAYGVFSGAVEVSGPSTYGGMNTITLEDGKFTTSSINAQMEISDAIIRAIANNGGDMYLNPQDLQFRNTETGTSSLVRYGSINENGILKGSITATEDMTIKTGRYVDLFTDGQTDRATFGFKNVESFRHAVMVAGVSSIKFLNGSTAQVQFRNRGDTAYVPIVASNVAVSSHPKFKKNIGEYQGNVLAKMLKHPVQEYNMAEDAPGKAKTLGLRTDNAPQEVIAEDGETVNLYAMTMFPYKGLVDLVLVLMKKGIITEEDINLKGSGQ